MCVILAIANAGIVVMVYCSASPLSVLMLRVQIPSIILVTEYKSALLGPFLDAKDNVRLCFGRPEFSL